MIDINKAIDYMYQLKNRGVTYSMNGSRIGTDGTADCSGAVYISLVKGGAKPHSYPVNTESEHAWLIANGFELIAFNKEWNMQRGDVLIFGIKGQSAGAGGHTAIAVDHNNVIHCNYAHNGVSVNPETTMPYSMGWYVYRYKGATQQPTQQSKPSTTGINWIKEEWRFTLSERIKLRTAPNTSATIIAELQPGDVVKYDAYCYSGGYVWIRQKRGNGYGYLATGECVGNKRTSYWGSFK
ncbi:SH3 domain-containing protein [Enterococcus cecorum]|uniref:peptidoglycan amidohydrolase family protein n=1 Tax=Enterococcus cecorum TaxID=44008 RepID=UPI001FABD2E7|nr:peptidoglycan amidohydrolase family protein [Enterococcus cecorum]MCJ0588137.1 SH3 domain-containing protein [Enterococcus cecorum]MCJ0591205.1 SH3 domain-containing protein [Enterococcus cecorum]